MLDINSGPVHISVEEGIGGTSLCLSLAASVLQSDSRVVWFARKPLEPQRTREILSEVTESQLDRLFIVEFGTKLLTRINDLSSLIGILNESDLIVLDDWCPSSGRAPTDDLEAVRKLISSTRNTRLILTSKAYESPSSDGEKWKSRGAQLSGLRQVWLLREEGVRNYRKLIDRDLETNLVLNQTGFIAA